MNIPINTDKDGNAFTIRACYFKNADYSTLTQWGGMKFYPATGVLELIEDEIEQET